MEKIADIAEDSGRRLTNVTDYKEKKAALEADNKVVTRPIPRLDDDIVPTRKNLLGRKRKYSPTKLKNEINRYFQWCEENDEVPSIKGLMIHCKMYKDQFYKYIKVPEYEDILEHTRLIIGNWAETDVYNTKGMAAGKLAYMKNVHDWTEKTENVNKNETRIISVDEARAKLEMLAPKLLELLKSSPTVLNQIGHIEGEVIDAS